MYNNKHYLKNVCLILYPIGELKCRNYIPAILTKSKKRGVFKCQNIIHKYDVGLEKLLY